MYLRDYRLADLHAELVDNWHKNIHLGLDLKGGSQLVLQVQIQDAFKAEADTVIQRLKDQLGAKGIAYADMSRNDPPTIQAADTIAIDIKGVPATRRAISGPSSTITSAASGI